MTPPSRRIAAAWRIEPRLRIGRVDWKSTGPWRSSSDRGVPDCRIAPMLPTVGANDAADINQPAMRLQACGAIALAGATSGRTYGEPVNLQQLRYLCAIVDHGLNVSDAAEALFTSQPGISKQIRQLEDELGVARLRAPGQAASPRSRRPAKRVVATARRALREIENLKRVGEEFRSEDAGTLAIATTHTQARYVLPPVLQEFADALPQGPAGAAPGQSGPGRRADAARRRRRRHRDRSARRLLPSSSRCPATSGTAACSCRAAIRWPRRSR